MISIENTRFKNNFKETPLSFVSNNKDGSTYFFFFLILVKMSSNKRKATQPIVEEEEAFSETSDVEGGAEDISALASGCF